MIPFYGLTENAINEAIAKYGEDKAVAFPGYRFTAFRVIMV